MPQYSGLFLKNGHDKMSIFYLDMLNVTRNNWKVVIDNNIQNQKLPENKQNVVLQWARC